MTTRLLALASPAMGSGKSTVAAHLVEHHHFVRVAFAAPIKRMVHALLGSAGYPGIIIDRYVSGDLKEVPLGDLPPFTLAHAKTMLAQIVIPAEISMGRSDQMLSLLEWGERYFLPGVTSRRLQQSVGTEWGRDRVHPDLWMLVGRDTAQGFLDAGISVVIDDMRFPNEFEAVQAAGGDCYRVCRPSATVTTPHISEGQLDRLIMPEIWNTGTIDELQAAADRAIFA